MRNTTYLSILLFVFIYLGNASAATQVSCSHPEICRLAKIIFNENDARDYEFTTIVTIAGDPHEYEPSSQEVKNLIKAPILVAGPSELNPWIKKVNYQRSKISNAKTINIQIAKKDYALYPGATQEALSHFWLYPQIFCSLKATMEAQFISLKMLPISISKKDCHADVLKIENDLRETLKAIKTPIILTHDALLPLLESLSNNKDNVVAIKGSGHHQEATPKSVKKLYDALKAPKAIWIEETGIKVPTNILSKKRPADLTVNIDTAKTEGLEYFQILKNLNEKLKALAL